MIRRNGTEARSSRVPLIFESERFPMAPRELGEPLSPFLGEPIGVVGVSFVCEHMLTPRRTGGSTRMAPPVRLAVGMRPCLSAIRVTVHSGNGSALV